MRLIQCRCFFPHRSRLACSWNVARRLLVFSGPSDLSSAKKGVSFVATYHLPNEKLRDITFIDSGVSTAVGGDLSSLRHV